MRISTVLLVVGSTMLATVPIVGAPSSRAQCAITGPSQVCPGDSIELCAPAQANATYLWQGPDGMLYLTDCLIVFDPGLYTLRVQDPSTFLWSEPCSLTVQSGRAAAPAITGPASTCGGAAVNWCGPVGSFEYAWSGPNGFAASTACVSVANAGDYFLRVRALPGGCWGDSTARSLAVTICGSAPTNCPRPAWWWAQAISGREHGQGRLDSTQVAAVAGCVNERSTALAWNDPAAGFTRTMEHERRTLRMRARRQFAAAWANVCAGQLGVVPRSGPPVALDPATPMDADLGGGTIAAWLAFAGGELARLEGMPERNPSVKKSYRGLVNVGWHINHGRGIGATCQSAIRQDARMAGPEAMSAVAADDNLEPLAAELLDDGDGPLALGVFEPNPFSTQGALAFSVSTTATVPVSIAVYDVTGRLVRELVRSPYAPGQYVVSWDGTASDGSRVKSGLYFIRGRAGDQQVQSRVSIIR